MWDILQVPFYGSIDVECDRGICDEGKASGFSRRCSMGSAMLAYVTVGSNDLAAAGAFYDAVLATLGYVRITDAGHEIGYGSPGGKSFFWVLTPFNRQKATFGNGVDVAFDAPSRAAVDAFHAAALAHGGTDEGGPGLRSGYGPTFYTAYVRDLDGNKLNAVFDREP